MGGSPATGTRRRPGSHRRPGDVAADPLSAPAAVRGPGRLVALEGIDGCGKSTQAARLCQRTGALATFEPGATGMGTAVRRLLLDPELPPLASRAEALLLAADRAQHVAELVAPTLATGRWVVTDRFAASTLAYQGAGRGLVLAELRQLVEFATNGLQPDVTVLLDLPVEEAARRLARQRLVRQRPDRFEELGLPFQQRVRQGYLELAACDHERWVVVDAAASADVVAEAVADAVSARLGPFPPAVADA